MISPKDNAAIVVEDNGPGIPPDQLERVRRPFERASCGGAYLAAEGAGLGLAIADGLAWRQGGHLTLESARGTGTRATMHLPLARRGRRHAEFMTQRADKEARAYAH